MPFYRHILKQAWQLTWRNKGLWWLGILAALLGSSGELEILFNNTGSNPREALFPAGQRLVSTGVFRPKTLVNIVNLFEHDTLNMIIFLLLFLAILVVLALLVWLVVISQAALVNNAAALLKQKKPSLSSGWLAGRQNFWPVLVINVLVRAVIYLLLAAVSLPAIFLAGNSYAKTFYVLAIVIMVVLAIVLSFIAKYSIAYAVINGYRAGEAIKQGWHLFKNNWLVSLEMAVILFLINFLAGLVVLLMILTLAVPFLFLGWIFYYLLAAIGSWAVVISAAVCFLFIIVASGAALAVYQIAAWTSLFLELDKKRGASKLVRLVSGLVGAD